MDGDKIMLYFKNLPTTTYDGNNVVNIFKRISISSTISEDLLKYYRMSEHETLFTVCSKFYDDPSIWWIIALVNDVNDVLFDFPVKEEIINKMALRGTYQTLMVTEGSSSSVGFSFVGGTISASNGASGTIINLGLYQDQRSIYVELDDPLIPFPNTIDEYPVSVVTRYGATRSIYIDNVTEILIAYPDSKLFGYPDSVIMSYVGEGFTGTAWTEDYISMYDSLVLENDNKRVIKVINPKYMSYIIADISRQINDF